MNQFRQTSSSRRSGFTLIELLVVIAIIGVLAGLLLAGVMVFLRKGPEVQTQNDILALSQGLQNFKGKYGVYPPNIIRLRSNMANYYTASADALDVSSRNALSQIFGLNSSSGMVPWAGSNATANDVFMLQGDQCLVFFLGGPPMTGGQPTLMGGFAVNNKNPADPTAGTRVNFMNFEPGRLFINPSGTGVFPSYRDPHGTQPYLYFSSTNASKRANGYDAGALYMGNNAWPTNAFGVQPYFSAVGKFYMPDSFQIISAGRDVQFGPGGQWANGTGPGLGQFGADDMTNFSNGLMGKGQ